MRREPIFIKRVEDITGKVIFETEYRSEQVISPQTAFLMTDMLADVVDHGTAWRARQLGFKLPAAGKTGTTNDYKDAWFVGYTPRLVTGVWIGFDQPQTIMGGGYATEVAVPLWASFMRKATTSDPDEWYSAPPGIVAVNVCRLSGKRPVGGCQGATYYTESGGYASSSTVYTEYFVKGTQPDDYCPIHGTPSFMHRVAGWFGASPSTPSPDRASDTAASVEREPDVQHADRRDDPPAEIHSAPEPKKKRGFWSKVFGMGDKDDDKKKKKKNEN